MADPKVAAGCRLDHITEGLSGFMHNVDVRAALARKSEFAVPPDEFQNLSPFMQKLVTGMGARLKPWTDKDRDAYRKKHHADGALRD